MGAGELAADALVRQGRHLPAGALLLPCQAALGLSRAGTSDRVLDSPSAPVTLLLLSASIPPGQDPTGATSVEI